jgi:hypothetical protein
MFRRDRRSLHTGAIVDLVKPSLVVGGEEQAVIGENYLALNYLGDKGDNDLSAEEEEGIPIELRKFYG